jgi:hypothetical protein
MHYIFPVDTLLETAPKKCMIIELFNKQYKKAKDQHDHWHDRLFHIELSSRSHCQKPLSNIYPVLQAYGIT